MQYPPLKTIETHKSIQTNFQENQWEISLRLWRNNVTVTIDGNFRKMEFSRAYLAHSLNSQVWHCIKIEGRIRIDKTLIEYILYCLTIELISLLSLTR